MFNKKETNKAHDTHKDRGERKEKERKSILTGVKKQTQDKKQKASGAAAAEK